MATTAQQSRYRARDDKQLVQVRLDPATVERLDRMVRKRGASGRAEVIEGLMAMDEADPKQCAREAVRLLRLYFQATGSREAFTRLPDGSTEMRIQYRP
ncbi:ribbon-helix-helix protein, CopG family [Thiocystis violacea]|uniref:ribbon-helix-helix protein, CopG family n=1 Tax=Thiocystis violacea TaxID=13725 RepID=UPI001904A581|nr:ribbon-helix-helix protein, CopG family [Thiocystis violacea]MBK1720336.1 hypothetical protein [Thiocystis violacea]